MTQEEPPKKKEAGGVTKGRRARGDRRRGGHLTLQSLGREGLSPGRLNCDGVRGTREQVSLGVSRSGVGGRKKVAKGGESDKEES